MPTFLAPEEPVSVLLVDDQPRNLVALQAMLDGLGLNVVSVRNGPDALRALLNTHFALVIMDVCMPVMDGLETAALIRSRPQNAVTPIIFVTAYESHEQLSRGYELGAIDYLIRPVVPAILRAKVNALVDLHRKTREIKRQSEVIRGMERRHHERELAAARERWEAERLRGEVAAARAVQRRFFPHTELPMRGLDVGGASFSADATGGDFFDYFPMLNDGLGLVIGDVSGHGYGPALLMAEIRGYLRALALSQRDLGELVSTLNQFLFQDALDDHFATLFVGRIEPSNGTLRYASAGHLTCYLLDADGRVKRSLESTGLPLAVMPQEVFMEAEPIALDPGDLLLLQTDGLVEATCDDGSTYGAERTLESVRANRRERAAEIVKALYRDVRASCRRTPQIDDMTALVVKVETSAASHEDSRRVG